MNSAASRARMIYEHVTIRCVDRCRVCCRRLGGIADYQLRLDQSVFDMKVCRFQLLPFQTDTFYLLQVVVLINVLLIRCSYRK